MEKPNIKNQKLLYRSDLKDYDRAFRRMDDNKHMGYTGIEIARRERIKLRERTDEENESDYRTDLVHLLDEFIDGEE